MQGLSGGGGGGGGKARMSYGVVSRKHVFELFQVWVYSMWNFDILDSQSKVMNILWATVSTVLMEFYKAAVKVLV